MPAITQKLVRLTGELTAYRAVGSDGWGVGTLVTDAEPVGVTGKLVGVRVGDTVEVEGTWEEHPIYGRRLKVRACTAQRPESPDGIVAWLVSTLPAVGMRRARQLVERFGAELWDVIEHRHHALCQVEGITSRRAEAIRDAYMANKSQRDDMVLLRGWGLTDNQVARCIERWNTLGSTVEHIRKNPYELSQCVYGFGFVRADIVAMKAGVKYDSPERVAAGVEHVLDEQSGKGHVFLPSGALASMTVKLLGVQAEQVNEAIGAAVRGGRLVRRGTRIYTLRMDIAEQQCAEALRKLLGRAAASATEVVQTLDEALRLGPGIDPSQQRAVELICSAPFGIVTGAPGTGKTTILKYALDELDKKRKRYELAAPTGKAAKRMNETAERPARTIHRLLEFHPGRGWQRNARNPIEADVVVVDESSMIDIELGAALFAAIDYKRTCVILIGDADQLPPVGPGRIFGDLVDAGAAPLVRLQTVHRSVQQSWIYASAPKVLRGELPDLTQRPDFRFVEVEAAADILPAVRELVVDVVPREIDADAQLLIPQSTGPAGIDLANRMLQQAINPRDEHDPFIPKDKGELRNGDRVIQRRNDYTLGVFNGEIGEIIELSRGNIVVQFDGREPVKYTIEQAGGLQLAYALTVHRAQGSEFPWVICVVHSTHSRMLTRQLVYTALTRGKQGVILVGDKKGLKYALNGKKPPRRNTALIERLRGELEPANDSEREASRHHPTCRDEHDDDEPVTIEDVTALRATDLALLCVIDGKQRWVPQSQITDDSEVYEVGGEGKLVVTGWWARKEGLGGA